MVCVYGPSLVAATLCVSLLVAGIPRAEASCRWQGTGNEMGFACSNNRNMVAVPDVDFAAHGAVTEQIFMDSNAITSIPAGYFDGLSRLNNLNLSWNRITEIAELLFRDLTALVHLYGYIYARMIL